MPTPNYDYSQMEMPNGASVADWLGTASLAARMAASFLNDMRDNNIAPTVAIRKVEDELVEALAEVRMIKIQLREEGLKV